MVRVFAASSKMRTTCTSPERSTCSTVRFQAAARAECVLRSSRLAPTRLSRLSPVIRAMSGVHVGVPAVRVDPRDQVRWSDTRCSPRARS